MDVEQWEVYFKQYLGAETVFEYEQTMNCILDDLEVMNPEDLLPEDQFLLGINPEDLATAFKVRRQVWQANLEPAVATAEHDSRRRNLPPECKHDDVPLLKFDPLI